MRKSKKSADFLDLLKEKGIISSSNKSSTHSEKKPAKLGSLFSELIKEMTTDPEIREKRSRIEEEQEPEYYDSLYKEKQQEDEVSLHEDVEVQRKRRQTEFNINEMKLRQKEERKNTQKKFDEEIRLKKEQEHLEKVKSELEAIKLQKHSVIDILQNKSSLRQAFVINEILSKPLGLK